MAAIGSFVLPIAGQALGFAIGGSTGAIIGSSLFGAIAGMFGSSGGEDNILLPTRYGSRLSDLRVQASNYGKVIPKVYGNLRISGNIIWSTDIMEDVVTDSNSYGGRYRGNTVNYAYSVSLAIAICKGSVDEVSRIWADGKLLTDYDLGKSQGRCNIHLGSEEQLPDSIIGLYKKHGTYPAYRGLCYIVIDRLQLDRFGNRIPNFSFEVKRSIRVKPDVEDKITDMIMIPGSGEYVYDTKIQTRTVKTYQGGIISSQFLNCHNMENIANSIHSLNHLQKTCPRHC